MQMSPVAVREIINEIRASISQVHTWKQEPLPGAPKDARCASGIGGKWRICVIRFGIPGGELSYEGTAASMLEGMVVRLPRDVAREAFEATGI